MPGLMYCLFQLPSIQREVDLDCASDCILIPEHIVPELRGDEKHRTLGLREVKEQEAMHHARTLLARALVTLLGQLSRMLPRRFDHFTDHLRVITLCQRLMHTRGQKEIEQEAYKVQHPG